MKTNIPSICGLRAEGKALLNSDTKYSFTHLQQMLYLYLHRLILWLHHKPLTSFIHIKRQSSITSTSTTNFGRNWRSWRTSCMNIAQNLKHQTGSNLFMTQQSYQVLHCTTNPTNKHKNMKGALTSIYIRLLVIVLNYMLFIST